MIGGGSGAEIQQAPEDDNGHTFDARIAFWRRFRRHPVALFSLVAILVVILIATVGPLIYHVDPGSFDLLNPQRDSFPTSTHLFGTDSLGRDTLARLLAGLRVSLATVALVETINIVLGMVVGLAAGYYGGWIDIGLSRLADVLFAFPGLLLAILVAGVFGPSIGQAYGGLGRLALVATSLALVSRLLMARYVRAETLSLRSREFIDAARALGVSDNQIIRRHIVSNVLGLVLTAATLDMASVVVNEAVLSLLGLGVQPPGSSIGLMISSAIDVVDVNWTEAIIPGLVLTLLVLAFSFAGDGLRDALDVRTQR